MADNEQELLSDEEIKPYLAYDGTYSTDIRKMLQAQIAKLKAMGWRSPEDLQKLCNPEYLDVKEANNLLKSLGYVKWDSEKVATFLAPPVLARTVPTNLTEYNKRRRQRALIQADQLYSLLKGGQE